MTLTYIRNWGTFRKRRSRKEGLKPWLERSQAAGHKNLKVLKVGKRLTDVKEHRCRMAVISQNAHGWWSVRVWKGWQESSTTAISRESKPDSFPGQLTRCPIQPATDQGQNLPVPRAFKIELGCLVSYDEPDRETAQRPAERGYLVDGTFPVCQLYTNWQNKMYVRRDCTGFGA